MPRLLDELHEDHRKMAAALSELDREVRRFEAGGRPDYDAIEQAVDFFVDRPDRWHHPVEEMVLARLRVRDPVAAARVGELSQSHEALSEHLRTFVTGLRDVMNDAELQRTVLVSSADDFIARQRSHLAAEEAAFFPAAERALSEADWRELEAAADALHRNLPPVERIWRCVGTQSPAGDAS